MKNTNGYLFLTSIAACLAYQVAGCGEKFTAECGDDDLFCDTTSSQGGSGGRGGSGGAGGGGSTSSSTSTMSSSTSSGSPTSTSSSGSGGGCGDGKKACNDTCVEIDEPDFGCAVDGCAPCEIDNATPTCAAGSCVIDSCNVGFADCNMMDSDGCEIDTQTDTANCGACDNACQNTTQLSCVTGACNGPCGAIPQVGYGLCYYGLAFDAGTQGSFHVGFAGAIVPSGQDILLIWSDPMNGATSVNAVNVSTQNAFLVDLGMLATNTVVQVEPGLHASQGAGTAVGTFACSSTCKGSALLYHNGVEVGALTYDDVAMTNTITGQLTLVDHFSPPARKDLQFTSQ